MHFAFHGGTQRGAIVNVVSDAARVGMSGEAVYSAAKGGLISLTKSLAQEMARHQVRLNAVSPGPIATGMLDENSTLDPARHLIEKMVQRVPLRRAGQPDEVAAAVVFWPVTRPATLPVKYYPCPEGLPWFEWRAKCAAPNALSKKTRKIPRETKWLPYGWATPPQPRLLPLAARHAFDLPPENRATPQLLCPRQPIPGLILTHQRQIP